MSDVADDEAWDEETMVEMRRFAVEQAIAAHLQKGGAIDLANVFKDADRIVSYIVGDLNP